MVSFSRALNETPDVCSPSRSVVSIISTERTIGRSYLRAASKAAIRSAILCR